MAKSGRDHIAFAMHICHAEVTPVLWYPGPGGGGGGGGAICTIYITITVNSFPPGPESTKQIYRDTIGKFLDGFLFLMRSV